MKKCLGALMALVLGWGAKAQGPAYTLDAVSWNVEWLGSATDGPADDNLQEANVRRVLRALDADLYGLLEVVDTARLRRLTDSLGSDFAFIVSPFSSGNTTGTGSTWRSAQKLAYIYRKSMFSNVSTRALLRTSNDAYYNFSSGRFPFLLNADVQVGGITRNMNFILLHAKAGSTPSDYTRRLDGARELKDTLDVQYSNSVNILLGDFNDALNRTICTSCPTTLSSYDPIIRDSTDGDHYRSLTLPLAVAGASTMTNYPNVIDNFVVSNEAAVYYMEGSAAIRSDIASTILNYGSTTSDHYPVSTRFYLGGITALPMTNGSDKLVHLYPNPASGKAFLKFEKEARELRLELVNVGGEVLQQSYYRLQAAGSTLPLSLPYPRGVYILTLHSKAGKQSYKIIVQ